MGSRAVTAGYLYGVLPSWIFRLPEMPQALDCTYRRRSTSPDSTTDSEARKINNANPPVARPRTINAIIYERTKLPTSTTGERGRIKCRYGKDCYRRNDQHKKEFQHPGDADYTDSDDESSKPYCQYGRACYRTNEEHIRSFNHSNPPFNWEKETSFGRKRAQDININIVVTVESANSKTSRKRGYDVSSSDDIVTSNQEATGEEVSSSDDNDRDIQISAVVHTDGNVRVPRVRVVREATRLYKRQRV